MSKGILLGHRISQHGIEIDVDKVQVIVALEPPKHVSELRGFLEHVGYYRRFIKDYAVLVDALTLLLKKTIDYIWEVAQQQAFKVLEKKLVEAPVLRALDWEKPFQVYVDTFAFAIEVMLSQKDEEKKDHPIYYASRQLTNSEKDYSTTEREALGMIFSVRKFCHYLLGCEFVFHVDHYALKHLVQKADL
ncbi:hypothetical protein R1flu_008458 [Riccia fluitans]|uniref:Reverse transcriptase/retrotransposon-derived protein RNase H-like domain-containing protein n=1 Tax=Riccia fluitans TaxID=41844 RepID=A0ABD1YBZ1_9MARC